jgi:hypothetical protein
MKHILLLGMILPAATGTAVQASDMHFYLGGSYGWSDADSGITVSTASLDEADNGYKAFLGLQITDFLALEGQYADLGGVSLWGNDGDRFWVDGTGYMFTADNAHFRFDNQSLGLSALFQIPIAEVFRPFVRIGYQWWKMDATATSDIGPHTPYSFNGDDLFYGGGLGFLFEQHLLFRLEFERYELSDRDIDFTSFSLGYQF